MPHTGLPSFPEGLYFVAFRCTQKNRGFVRVSGGKFSKTFFCLPRWTRKQTESWPLQWQRFPAGSCRLRTVEAGAAGWQSNARRLLGYERSVLPNFHNVSFPLETALSGRGTKRAGGHDGQHRQTEPTRRHGKARWVHRVQKILGGVFGSPCIPPPLMRISRL